MVSRRNFWRYCASNLMRVACIVSWSFSLFQPFGIFVHAARWIFSHPGMLCRWGGLAIYRWIAFRDSVDWLLTFLLPKRWWWRRLNKFTCELKKNLTFRRPFVVTRHVCGTPKNKNSLSNLPDPERRNRVKGPRRDILVPRSSCTKLKWSTSTLMPKFYREFLRIAVTNV